MKWLFLSETLTLTFDCLPVAVLYNFFFLLQKRFIEDYNQSFWAKTICHSSHLHIESPVAEDTV